MICRDPDCGRELTTVSVNSHLAYVCFAWQCREYRHPQHYEPRPEPVAAPTTRKPRDRSASYRQQRQNYRRLREAGIPCVEASRLTSNKQTRLALEAAGVP